MLESHYLVWLVVFLALAFDYINGFHDTANAIATSVSTRAIEPKKAIMMTAALNFLGAMVSTGVAKTIGGDIVMYQVSKFHTMASFQRLLSVPSYGIY